MDGNVIISVISRLFMPQTNAMKQLMDDDAVCHARGILVVLQRDLLDTALHTGAGREASERMGSEVFRKDMVGTYPPRVFRIMT